MDFSETLLCPLEQRDGIKYVHVEQAEWIGAPLPLTAAGGYLCPGWRRSPFEFSRCWNDLISGPPSILHFNTGPHLNVFSPRRCGESAPKPPEYQVGFTPKTSQIERERTEAQEAISHAARSQTCWMAASQSSTLCSSERWLRVSAVTSVWDGGTGGSAAFTDDEERNIPLSGIQLSLAAVLQGSGAINTPAPGLKSTSDQQDFTSPSEGRREFCPLNCRSD